jgi:hypothetical protein
MVRDEDIRRSAEGMVKIYGKKAADECLHQAQKYRSRNDDIGYAVWERVLNDVRVLSGSVRAPEILHRN